MGRSPSAPPGGSSASSPVRPTRRSLLQLFGSAAALGLVDPLRAANLLAPDPTRLSWLAHRTAGAEGAWNLEIDGELPAELRGTMFRKLLTLPAR